MIPCDHILEQLTELTDRVCKHGPLFRGGTVPWRGPGVLVACSWRAPGVLLAYSGRGPGLPAGALLAVSLTNPEGGPKQSLRNLRGILTESLRNP